MILFVLMVFGIYGGVHVYAFLRARSVLGFGPLTGIALGVFMLFMVFSLFLIRRLETHEYEVLARILSYITYFWMALLFVFFTASLTLDLITLVARCASWIAGMNGAAVLVPQRIAFFLSLGLSVLITTYGYFEASDIRTERLVIETDKLPAGMDKLTIAQISDVHLGMVIRSERFRPMIKAVLAAKPDLFVVTGDLVDAQINHLPGLAEMIREVKPKFGRYAIMGNHEYYAGPDRSVAFIKEAGLTLLRDQVDTTGPITIVGIDDRTATQLNLGKPHAEHDILQTLSRDKFILYLKHQPRIDRSTIGLFDLQLSGHTHKGQIYPFVYLVRMNFPWIAGAYDLGQGSILYVNRGTGTWGPPVRFLSPPEVTVVELVRKKTL